MGEVSLGELTVNKVGGGGRARAHDSAKALSERGDPPMSDSIVRELPGQAEVVLLCHERRIRGRREDECEHVELGADLVSSGRERGARRIGGENSQRRRASAETSSDIIRTDCADVDARVRMFAVSILRRTMNRG